MTPYTYTNRLILFAVFAVSSMASQYSAGSNLLQSNDVAKPGPVQMHCAPTPAASYNSTQWTVFGEVQEMRTRISRPNWPIQTDTHQLITLSTPLNDKPILPYSDPVPNASGNKTIPVIASPGEYEPASFVLRAGIHPMSNTTLVAHDLMSSDKTETIPAKNIDLRVVKPWYQSASVLRRVHPGQTKQFVPELLLHDDSLVQVDHQRHVNLVRTWPTIRDALSIVPFTVQACTNKQVWVTIKVPDNTPQGYYKGRISIEMNRDGTRIQDYVDLELEVLPIRLLKPEYTMGMFYLGWLTKPKNASFTARSKTSRQMKEEFIDMREHGVDTVGLDHSYKSSKGVKTAFNSFRKPAQMLLDSGFSNNVLAYVDWQVAEAASPDKYKNKIGALSSLSKALGYKQLWVYNRDEKGYKKLISQRHTFETTHALGALNMVAVTKAKVAQRLKGLLDIAIIKHNTPESLISSLKSNGTTPLAYGMPHSAEEKASTTRATYGFEMAGKGFSGVFSYAYQSGQCWNDWAKWGKQNYRPSIMAYPTADKPIPTLQWEGWREAVDDLRYLATYLQKTTGRSDGNWPAWLKASIHNDSPQITRQKLIEKLRENAT